MPRLILPEWLRVTLWIFPLTGVLTPLSGYPQIPSGEFKLFQDGNKISGKFISSSNSTLGDINGTLQDDRVEFTRTWENKSQFYILNLSPDGQVLEGTFRGDQDPDTSIGVEFRATRQGSNHRTSLDGAWNDAWGTGAWRIRNRSGGSAIGR